MTRFRRKTSSFIKEFQEFALKGNVIDLAIAVIIGGAFGKIITSFVEDLVMPLINPLIALSGKDWRTITIGSGIKIGQFLGSVVDFLVIAFILFLAIRSLQRFKRQEAVDNEPPLPDPQLVAQEKLTDALDKLTQTLESRNPQI
ncbi:large conductance mechanosensitive channel protein MscL [Anabaena minutissima FACHB-250]|nr:large conductance mechanosensitive channel protein MscL [Anabaena minutissima FACHB-250]